jgi:hypothetical protein
MSENKEVVVLDNAAVQLPAIEEAKDTERDIVLGNIEVYQDAITKFKKKIAEQVKAGVMSEQVAVKIVLENEYGFFQQIVQVAYK